MKRSFIILLHTGYWLLYLFLIFGFLLFVPNGYRHGPISALMRVLFASPLTINFILFEVIGFYIFYSVLFPRFLYRKKFFSLFISAFAICIISAYAGILLSSLVFNTKSLSLGWQDQAGIVVFLSILVGIHGTIALVIRGFITWYSDIKLKEELNQKNYETELALVKSQINPHFLFNTINNIDVLILKDGEKASAFLKKLSDIMRFMLYETKAEKIPLQKELDYIENYIELQKIRTSNPDFISYTVTGNTLHLLIGPMLFIPFIENAFKYAESNKVANAVKIGFVITEKQLLFTCENSYSENPAEQTYGGLGNELIRKRLELMYPANHTLEIINKDKNYRVNLRLYFHAD